ncbi:hypothetical protein PSZ74_23850, partial [Shigella sonnei]|nr:hypothetical protein [Shigella sonnei]
MQWIPCSMVKCIPIERSVFHAAWLNGSRLNAVDSMQRGPMDQSDKISRDLLGTEFERWNDYIKISINSLTPFCNSL